MAGLRPIIEFMTFNFSILATDQIINSAAKMLYMSGGQFNIPIVFRGPGGSAFQVSSQHSQALESWYAYFPGLKVVMPSTPADAKGLLKSSIRDNDPVIFIEQERMYGQKGEVPDDPDFTIPLGVADIKREGTDVTVVAYMGMMYRAMEAAEELAKEGISVEIVDPRTLRPMDTDTIIASVKKTGRSRHGRRGLAAVRRRRRDRGAARRPRVAHAARADQARHGLRHAVPLHARARVHARPEARHGRGRARLRVRLIQPLRRPTT